MDRTEQLVDKLVLALLGNPEDYITNDEISFKDTKIAFKVFLSHLKKDQFDIDSIINDPNYLAIIDLGYSAIPLILKELYKNKCGDIWDYALRTITGFNLITEKYLTPEKIAECWLGWGREKGITFPSDDKKEIMSDTIILFAITNRNKVTFVPRFVWKHYKGFFPSIPFEMRNGQLPDYLYESAEKSPYYMFLSNHQPKDVEEDILKCKVHFTDKGKLHFKINYNDAKLATNSECFVVPHKQKRFGYTFEYSEKVEEFLLSKQNDILSKQETTKYCVYNRLQSPDGKLQNPSRLFNNEEGALLAAQETFNKLSSSQKKVFEFRNFPLVVCKVYVKYDKEIHGRLKIQSINILEEYNLKLDKNFNIEWINIKYKFTKLQDNKRIYLLQA